MTFIKPHRYYMPIIALVAFAALAWGSNPYPQRDEYGNNRQAVNEFLASHKTAAETMAYLYTEDQQ